MKNKLILPIMIAVACLCFSSTANAQGDAGEHVFTLDAGFSVTGGLIEAVFETGIDSNGNVTNNPINGGPAIVLGYDFGLSERWSIGAILTTQGWSGTDQNTYFDANNNTVTEEISFNLRRNNFSIVPRLHYGNGDNIDLYSGIRIGYVFWTSKIESNDPAYSILDDYASGVGRLNVGIVPFGARFYVTDNIGINFETALGAPYMFGAGLNYKII